MKKHLIRLSIVFGLILAAGCIYYVPYPEEGYPTDERGYYEDNYRDYPSRQDTSYFYEYLAPYGAWVSYSPYGYVWIPYRTGYGWRPYTYGRWVWTSHGWTWVSSFEWGWAPFHYGRWGWDVSIGWYWVPGHIWSPAWVAWRNGGSWIGWAALPPDVEYIFGVGVTRLPYPVPDSFWVFVDGRHFLSPGIHDYVLPVERNYTIVRTTVSKVNILDRNRVIVNQGVDLDRVSQLTKKSVSKVELIDSRHPGSARARTGEIEIHRPQIRENERAEPEVVISKDEAREELMRTRMIKGTEESSDSIESRIQEEQSREIKRLKESQEEEMKRVTQSRAKALEDAKTTQEREKLEKKYESQMNEVKQKHKTEETLIKQRHEKEAVKAKEKKTEDKKAEKKEVKKTKKTETKESETKSKNSSEAKTIKTKKIRASR